jgi:flavin reductase (DIM6/NTAB) family NADH-FMN oxidoreductase RutF
MTRESIPFEEFNLNPLHRFHDGWFALSAGDFATGKYNSMTISWGTIGILWEKPIVHVVVRPTRYTAQFMDHYDTFTLCAFNENYRDALNLLGTLSGRDGDKIERSNLSPIASVMVAAPCFSEAELIIECRKIYWGDLDPVHFLAKDIASHYDKRDYHRFYYGEILHIQGEAFYRREV